MWQNMSVNSQFSDYTTRLRDLNIPLRLLTESELSRLSVWFNPTNDIKRSADVIGATERGLLDTTWVALIRCVWSIDPTIVIHLPERFKLPLVRNEVSRLVRSSPKDVLHVCEAVHFLLGESFDPIVRRDHKVDGQENRFSCSYSDIITVSSSVASGAPHHRDHLLRTTIQQSTTHSPICASRIRRTSC